ncbi:ribosome biogenesis regulatory protein [Plasmopara halstedii]|uniref:Ribosome biogenesis regulatory protein n=1 Tax=Plasmopara halstedii TaxID=4781 RepID=A0A0P1AKY9_PLAHL|nr:ribosome biogenesis regulatory protein [Plasmopara halstedii]CEG41616.1 ribosome biogenesis regulatory protein [Plasmopara halstedii]|eukprot:XP_024577985.1 ribosome biogenesis regulatory protein [Plasmopara halstedii]
MVVKASEIAPVAYAEGTTSTVEKEDDLTYDLGNLAAFDTHPFVYQNEKELALHARENVQLLINRIFELPRVMSDMGPLAQLPEPEVVIPREKPLPKPKVETKWEKFAKEKGIEKRKKSRKVFDEEKGEWSHSWGYQRAGDDLKDWAVEMKAGDMEDPWTKRKQEKRAQVDKNVRAQMNNKNQGRGKQLAGRTPTGIPVELMNTDDVKAKQRGKDGTSKTLEKVQFSTASMGKFDKMREGEAERKVKGKRNHFLPTTGAEATEKERSMNILKRVLGREENDGKKKGKLEEEDEDGKKRKKKGKKLKNFTKGATKKRRTK